MVVSFFGAYLEVSSNYFVLLPLTAAALSYGLPGGILARLLALPCNLALFVLQGRQDFFPDNLALAQISGSMLGLVCGSLGGYFKRMESEYAARNQISKRLDAILLEKELMLDEIHHRVRNNLSMIMSLIQLQALDSPSKEFRQAASLLTQRLVAISLIHHICQAQDPGSLQVNLEASHELPELNIDTASALGLILNEVITNSVKHGFVESSATTPTIDVKIVLDGPNWIVTVQDNGRGFPIWQGHFWRARSWS